MDNKGQFTDLFLFFIIMVFGLVMFVFLGGIGANLISGFYSANQQNIDQVQLNVNKITNANVQGDLNNIIDNYNDQQAGGIAIFLTLSTYGAIFTVLLIVIVLFLIRRQDVQVGRIG